MLGLVVLPLLPACFTLTRQEALDRAGPAETRLAVERTTLPDRHAPPVQGTVWRLEAELPDLGVVNYEVRFSPYGKLESMSPRDLTPDDDSWSQDGSEIVLRMNDGFAEYHGVFLDEERVEGEASNSLGAAWPWRLERVE